MSGNPTFSLGKNLYDWYKKDPEPPTMNPKDVNKTDEYGNVYAYDEKTGDYTNRITTGDKPKELTAAAQVEEEKKNRVSRRSSSSYSGQQTLGNANVSRKTLLGA